jgi:glycine hydroxymethyltransferase
METLARRDPEIARLMAAETARARGTLSLIASENVSSQAVRDALGGGLTDKYAEGYPDDRFYEGCEAVDRIEDVALARARALIAAAWANVQPHSGSSANLAVLMAFLRPGDRILGMSGAAGGHFTHGGADHLSGRWFEGHAYGLGADGRVDPEIVRREAKHLRPALLIAGGSFHPREIPVADLAHVAEEVGALLLFDMAHTSGLVAAGLHANPVRHADIVSSTTHKTLRGPRGGLLLSRRPDLGARLDAAIFPGLQGGPLLHAIAAKAVAFGEAAEAGFRTYAETVVASARALGGALAEAGFPLSTGGTDCHFVVVDLRGAGLDGAGAAAFLAALGLVANKCPLPDDPDGRLSGIRLGTPSGVSRGLGPAAFDEIGGLVARGLRLAAAGAAPDSVDGQGIGRRLARILAGADGRTP